MKELMRPSSMPCAGWPGEEDLADLAVIRSGETDWQELQEDFRPFGDHPDLLLAEIILRSGRMVPLYLRPGQKGGHLYLHRNLEAAFEYSEPAKDKSGNTVRLMLTLRPDGLEGSNGD